MVEGKKSFFLRKKTTLIIGVIALIFGFVFLNEGIFTGRVTGNAVVSEYNPIFSALSIIGILLVLCAGILIIYSMIKEE